MPFLAQLYVSVCDVHCGCNEESLWSQEPPNALGNWRACLVGSLPLHRLLTFWDDVASLPVLPLPSQPFPEPHIWFQFLEWAVIVSVTFLAVS